ncbi:helix-turn-helix domain-containing protein [Bradyrhizobium sp. USDA 329]|uniref:helix-turn-helix domain-containing protein n=1 Tax=unclassified Bradyrhizobium TaxID=2631580 RepID=UPI0035169F05
MSLDSKDFRTPGQFVSALMEQRSWTQVTLAVVLGLDKSGVARLVADKRPIDAELALTLEELFEVPAEQFLSIQHRYDLALARVTRRPDSGRSVRAHLYGQLPISEMIKRGWINAQDIRDPAVTTELMRFFGVNRIEDIEVIPHSAKKTEVNTPATPTQLAWLYRVKQIASQMLVAKYSPAALPGVLAKLKGLLGAAEEARKVPRILAEHGIRFLIVETLPSAKIDGVCFWLDETSPVVAMSLRFDRIDNFWFVLRHELEHVRQRHGLGQTYMLDAELEGDRAGTGDHIEAEEREANSAAADFCVPQKMMDAFIARKAPLFPERDILAFAKMASVHPGLIAGQLRHRIGRYDRFGNHITKIRSIVAPNAIRDGWGDVQPLGNL